MKSLLCALCLVLAAPPALAQTGAGAPPAAKTAERKISVEFRGSLRDALKQIASRGGVNLVVTGKLDQDAEVYLKDVTVTEALQTVAEAYQLKLESKGKIWTLRPLTAEEVATAAAAPAPVVAPSEAAPIPPLPPAPPAQEGTGLSKIEREVRRAEARAREAEMKALQSEVRSRVSEQLKSRVARIKKHGNDDLVLTGGSGVVEEGQSVQDAVVYGGNLDVRGHVNGDVAVFGGSVHLFPTAVVEGDITTFGGKLIKEEGAVVEGEHLTMDGSHVGRLLAGGPLKWSRGPIHFSMNDDEREPAARNERSGRRGSGVIPAFLLWFSALFGIGFLFNIFAPARMKEVSSELVKEPLKCGLTGFVALIALIPLTVLLAITLVGIPVAALMWIVAAVGVLLGISVVASEIGLRLPVLQGRKTQALILALGLLAVLLVSLVPVLGVLAVITVATLGFGALVRTRFGNKPKGFPEPVV